MPHDILVVEDDGSVRKMLCTALTAKGFRTTGCTTGEEALSMVRRSCFDAVIIDHFLPALTGTETTKELRIICPRSVIIGMSGSHSGKDFVESGGDLFMPKPFNVAHVVVYLQTKLS